MESSKQQTKSKKSKAVPLPQFTHSGDKIKDGNTKFTFGKYKDLSTFSDVYEQDPGYFKWFQNMNKEPIDHLKTGTNKQTTQILEYIKNRSNVEPLKETVKFIKRKPKQDKEERENQFLTKLMNHVNPNKQEDVVAKLEMNQKVTDAEIRQSLNANKQGISKVNVKVSKVYKEDQQPIVNKPQTHKLK